MLRITVILLIWFSYSVDYYQDMMELTCNWNMFSEYKIVDLNDTALIYVGYKEAMGKEGGLKVSKLFRFIITFSRYNS